MTTNSSKARRNVPPPAGSTATKGSLYTRFIPREELSSFAAWEPSEFDGQGEKVEAPPVEDVPEVDPAIVIAEQMRAARQGGYQDGYRDGLAALEGFKQSFAHQTTLQIGALLQSFAAQLDALQQQMAQTLSASATSLARQVVRSELAARPELVALVAQEAIDTLMLTARHITVRVHPDDQPLVAEGAAEVLEARGARLVADASVLRGGCLVDSDIGSIDASLETRWRRASAALGGDAEWNAEDARALPAARGTA